MAYFNSFYHPAFLDAVASLPERKQNDGTGRAAAAVSLKFGVSISTVYQARAVFKRGKKEIIKALRNGDLRVKTAYKQTNKRKENIMNINGFEELSYFKNSDYLLKEINNIEKTLNDAGYTSDVNPRFSLENNKISFDLRVSFPFSQSRPDGKTTK